MEQPELHLHPAHQAQLADVFSRSLRSQESSNPLRLIIETHSNEFINRLGALVEEGSLRSEDVDIYVVDAEEENVTENAGAYLRLATFDKNGALQNWPAGFFTPSH